MSKIVELDETNTCKLCNNALAKYSCPKCSTIYCSLACYQSETHLNCSESFYKECIVQELSIDDGQSSELKAKMMEMLQRNQIDGDDDNFDSDDEVQDICQRLTDVNLDNPDEIWAKLSEDERNEFVAMLKSGDISKLIKPWVPWWTNCAKQDNVEDCELVAKWKNECPAIRPIRPLDEISSKPPAECVKHNLVNILCAYAFVTRYFNGDHFDFPKEVATYIATLSLQLKSGENFASSDDACNSVRMQCDLCEWIVADKENYDILNEDVPKILKGPAKSDATYYILAALSDLCELFTLAATKERKKEEKDEFGKKFPNAQLFPTVKLVDKAKLRSCLRKFDYYLSYTISRYYSRDDE